MFGNRDAEFTPSTPAAWITLADAKAAAGVTDSELDARITALLATACAQIERYTGLLVSQRTVTEYLYPEDPVDVLVLGHYPVSALTSLHIDDVAETLSDLRLSSATGMVRFKDGSTISGREIKVVYVVGWLTANVPAPLIEAAKQLVKELYDADSREFAIRREATPDVGEIEYRDDPTPFVSNGVAVSAPVAALLASFVRRAV